MQRAQGPGGFPPKEPRHPTSVLSDSATAQSVDAVVIRLNCREEANHP